MEYGYVYIITSILGYMVSSIALSLYNRWLFGSYDNGDFRFPILALFSSSIVSFTLATVITLKFQSHLLESNDWLPNFGWKRYVKEIAPVALLFTLDTCATNAALETIPIALLEVIKSAGIMVLVLIAFISGREEFRISTALVMLLVTLGACLAVYGDTEHDPNKTLGILWTLVGTFSGLFRILLMEYLFQDKSLPPLLYLMYSLPIVIITLIPAFFLIEYKRFVAFTDVNNNDIRNILIQIFCITGVLAFGVNISIAGSLACTSAVTFQVVGVVKLVFLIGISMIIGHEKFSKINEIGIILSIIGVSLYQYIKIQRMVGASKHDKLSDDSECDDNEYDNDYHYKIRSVVGAHNNKLYNPVNTFEPPLLDFPNDEHVLKKSPKNKLRNENLSTFDMEVQALLNTVDDDAADEIHFMADEKL